MSKRYLITGAATGFGQGTALELARRGHHVIAGVLDEGQRSDLAALAADKGVTLQIELLDITNETHRESAFSHDIDVLINNAGIMQAGPVAEIPMDRVRSNFEVNVFGTLAMVQGFARQMVERGSGKIIIVSSMGGLITVPFVAIYTATKHALESFAEGMKAELAGTGVEVCTVNPGVFGTGFNDRGAATMEDWFDPETSLSAPEVLAAIEGSLEDQMDPQVMVDAMVRIAEEESSQFRNVVPEETALWIRAIQENTWKVGKDDMVWIDPASL